MFESAVAQCRTISPGQLPPPPPAQIYFRGHNPPMNFATWT